MCLEELKEAVLQLIRTCRHGERAQRERACARDSVVACESAERKGSRKARARDCKQRLAKRRTQENDIARYAHGRRHVRLAQGTCLWVEPQFITSEPCEAHPHRNFMIVREYAITTSKVTQRVRMGQEKTRKWGRLCSLLGYP